MLTAIRKVHAKNGLWNSKGGVEFNLVLIAAAVLAAERPGKASVDAGFGRSKWGAGWAVFAVLAGVLGSSLAIAAGRRFAPVTSSDAEVSTQDTDEKDTRDE